MKKYSQLIILATGMGVLILFGILVWSGIPNYEYESGGYTESLVNEEFPVPVNAESSDAQYNNPNVKYGKKYSLKNIGGDQGLYPPTEYFNEVKEWGWEEVENERMGHVHFFQKEDTIISIEIHEDYFHLYKLREGFEFSHGAD